MSNPTLYPKLVPLEDDKGVSIQGTPTPMPPTPTPTPMPPGQHGAPPMYQAQNAPMPAYQTPPPQAGQAYYYQGGPTPPPPAGYQQQVYYNSPVAQNVGLLTEQPKKSGCNGFLWCCCLCLPITLICLICLCCICCVLIPAFAALFMALPCLTRHSELSNYTFAVQNIQTINIQGNVAFDIYFRYGTSDSYHLSIERLAPKDQKISEIVTAESSVLNMKWSVEELPFACASVNLTIVLPLNFAAVQRVLINGRYTSVHALALANIALRIDGINSEVNLDTVEVKSIEVHTSNGRISARGIKAATAVLESTNAELELNTFDVAHINATSSNGRLIVKNFVVTSASFKSSNGHIQLVGVTASNSLAAATTNGKIEASFAASNFNLESTNGNVDASVTSFAGNFTVETTNGEAQVSGPNVKFTVNNYSTKAGTVGVAGAGVAIVKSTNSGAICRFN